MTLQRTKFVRSMHLRTLLLIVLLVSLATAQISKRFRETQRRNDVIARIRGCNGGVEYDWQQLELGPTGEVMHAPRQAPPGPAWLRRIIGADYFQVVTSVELLYSGDPLHGGCSNLELVSQIAQSFPHTRSLTIECSEPSEAMLEKVSHLKKLERLVFLDEKITDAAIAHLRRLTNLKALSLEGGPRVTDNALYYLSELPRLEYLRIVNGRFSNRGLAHIPGYRSLRELNLRVDSNAISDTGFSQFKLAPKLRHLSLIMDRAAIDPESLRHLKRVIGLDNMNFEDAP
jgi:hypothetical protein